MEDKIKEVALMPCPFCGSKAVSVKTGGYNCEYVYCHGCETTGPDGMSEEHAAERWNRRVSIPAAEEDAPHDQFFRKPDGSVVMVPRDAERLSAEEDVRDAARYRWLKGNAKADPKMDGNHIWWLQLRPMRGQEFDSAIDVAMSQDSKGEGK